MTSRRNFIKKSALGLTALAVTPSWAREKTTTFTQAGKYVSQRPHADKMQVACR